MRNDLLQDGPNYLAHLSATYPPDHWVLAYRRQGLARAVSVAALFEPWARPGARFLEVGCGDGSLPIVMNRLGYRAAGLDVAEHPLRLAAARARELDLSVEWLQGSALELPFGDETFDLVAANDVLEHLPSPSKGLREMARVLRPGGAIYVNVTNRLSLLNIWAEPHARLPLIVLLPFSWAQRLAGPGYDCYSPLSWRAFRGLLDDSGLAPLPCPIPGLAEKLRNPERVLHPLARVFMPIIGQRRAEQWCASQWFLRYLCPTLHALALKRPHPKGLAGIHSIERAD